MAEPRASNPLVDQFRRGGIPKELRLMAAQGLLPLKPTDVLELLHLLLADSDVEVHGASEASLKGFPKDELLPIAKDRETPPAVLAWALVGRDERDVREAVLQNVSTPDEAI